MLNRAYSLIDVKAFDPIKRTFSGIATSPEPDRVGDIIESEGVTFASSVPLLLYHDNKKPVGEARFGNATKDGHPFNAQISSLDRESGAVRERLDEAVDSLSAKPPLLRGVSIGFRPLADPTYNKATGGFIFPKIEILELSMVTVPAHQNATIDVIKSLDSAHRPLSADGAPPVTSTSPAVVGTVGRPSPRHGRAMKKSISDQIKEFEATRMAKSGEQDTIMDTAAEAGLTLDEAQKEQYDTLDAEIKSIDDHLVRLRAREESNKAAAVEVKGADITSASASRGGSRPVITVRQNTEPGIAMARIVICKMASFLEFRKGNMVSALDFAQKYYRDDPMVVSYLKTAVAGGTSTDTNWAGELVEPATIGFVEWLRHKTIVGKLNLQRRPFNIRTPRQTTGGAGYWVGEGKPKPLTKFHFDAVTLPYTKVAAIAVITQELARFSSPSAEQIVRDQLTAACQERLDTDIIDPDKAVSSGVNPASLTNGVTALSSAGTSAANVITDIQSLIEQFILNKQDPSGLVLVMPNTLALVVSLMLTANGTPQFPAMTMNGGNLLGIPVIASQYAASGASYGNMVIAIDQNAVALADDGGFTVDVSTEASLQMDDAPSNDASDGTGQSLVSLWQTNSIGIRAEREIHWVKLRSTAVSFIDDVNWGSVGSPV